MFYILSFDVRFQENSKNDNFEVQQGNGIMVERDKFELEDIILGAGSATFSAGFVNVSAGPGDIDANTERVTFSPGASNLPANFFFIKFPKLAMFSPDLS